MTMGYLYPWVLLITSLLLAACSQTHHNPAETQRFEFALIGDVPYQTLPGETDAALTRLIAAINAQHDIAWVLHSGDIKGTIPCSDEVYHDRIARFQAFAMPFILTPGDNDWTDCHQRSLGGYHPLERLARLRALFFGDQDAFGRQPLGLVTQATQPAYRDYREHLRWVKEGVVFATLHVVGSENGLRDFNTRSVLQRTPDFDTEAQQRIAAVIAWMDEAFSYAIEHNSPGVFLLMHANPGLEFRQYRDSRHGYEEILAALERNIVAYGKPVVLAHGDTHYFRIDKPRVDTGDFLATFTRLENFGPTEVHWVRITVAPGSPEVFSFRAEMMPAASSGRMQ